MGRLSLFFAKRYLLSRKSLSVINIISRVSSFTVAIPVMAMVVLLSVFNGFDSLIKSMYKNFDPDILITLSEGRFFDRDSIDGTAVRSIPGVAEISYAIDENVLLEYRGAQRIATIRGVDSMFREVVPIENMVVAGKYEPRLGDLDQVLLGQGIAYEMAINHMLVTPLSVYVPRRGRYSPLLPSSIYREGKVFPSGVFALDAETDGQYVIVPLSFAQKLLDYGEEKVSSAMVRLAGGSDPDKVRAALAAELGDTFVVRTRYQQKKAFYRIMQYEKWAIYFIILMVLVIASFSVIGSLVMIIIDKKKDIQTLITLGAGQKFLRSIFINEGMMISGIGMVLGIALGVAICVIQQQFGLVSMGGVSFLVDAYPVQMKLSDILGVIISVGVINYVISWFTVTRLINKKYIA